VETPWGLLARSFVDGLLRDGSRNISRCRLHRPPELRLLEHPARAARSLYQASANGEKSPEGWAATRIRAALEQLELASRPEVDRSTVRAKDHGCVCRLLVGFEFGCAVLKRGNLAHSCL